MRAIFITTMALCLLNAAPTFAQKNAGSYGLAAVTDASRWTLINVDAESVIVDGRTAVHLVSHADSANGIVGLALPYDKQFKTGVIDVDLKGKSIRGNSFLGIAFNLVDEKKFEAVYFRPFNFNADLPFRDRGVQYISWPGNSWEHLRKTFPNTFENRVSNVPNADDWFHARIAITETQVSVFVNNATEPSLVVKRLVAGDVPSRFGLFVDTSDGFYANLRVTHMP